MYHKVFNAFGWIILIGTAISWIIFGYSSWYLLSAPVAYISFSIYDGSIKRLENIAALTAKQISLLILSYIITVAVAFGLIQLFKYLIDDLLNLQSWVRSVSVVIAIILAIYPAKLTFGTIFYKTYKSESPS